MKKRSVTEKVARLSVLLTLSMLLSYIEHIAGFDVGIYGVKVGFANLVGLFALYRFGFFDGITVNICRILLSAVLFGNAFSLLYSLCGGILSFLFMAALKKARIFGTVGVSVCDAACHNMVQLGVAAALVGNVYVFSYAPVLLIAGTVFGTVNGLLCAVLLKKVPKRF